MSTAQQLIEGKLLCNLDYDGNIVDLCWPLPGEDNLLQYTTLSKNLYTDKQLQQLSFTVRANYVSGQLISTVYDCERSNILSVQIDYSISLDRLTAKYKLVNLDQQEHLISLILNNRPDFGSNKSKDSAVYYPFLKGLVHYEGDRYLAITSSIAPHSFACQDPQDFSGTGASPDGDLNLTNNPVTTGRLDTALRYDFVLGAEARVDFEVYYILGNSYRDLELKFEAAISQTRSTQNQMQLLEAAKVLKVKEPVDNLRSKASNLAERLSLTTDDTKKLQLLLQTSYYLVRNSFTPVGGNFAALDSGVYKNDNGSDDYSYFWPRDGSISLLALLGKAENGPASASVSASASASVSAEVRQIATRYFNFVAQCFADNPYLLHRYRLYNGGQLGSSWYPWTDSAGGPRLPLQLDQTCLVIIALGKYLAQAPTEADKLLPILRKLPTIADFLLTQSDSEGMHLPCYDLWENHWGNFTSTQASLIGALEQLQFLNTNFAAYMGPETVSTNSIIDKITLAIKLSTAALGRFVSDEGRLIRGFIVAADDSKHSDLQLDASFHWLWQLGAIKPEQDYLVSTVASACHKLRVISGFLRYEEDYYLRQPGESTGNSWFISTMWFIQYALAVNDLAKAKEYLELVLKHMEPTGLLAEMSHPNSGYGLSVRPLIWSHAEVLNLLRYY